MLFMDDYIYSNKIMGIWIFWQRSAFFLSLSFSGFNSNFFVVHFKGSKIFSDFREFSFFHTFSNIPMYKGSLGIHQVEFMAKSWEDFGNGGGVGNHADSSHDFSEITSWDNSWWLIVNSDFESSWGSIIEFNGSLGVDGSNSGVNILGELMV